MIMDELINDWQATLFIYTKYSVATTNIAIAPAPLVLYHEQCVGVKRATPSPQFTSDFLDFSDFRICGGVSLFTGLDYWNGILDWTTGMTFVLFCEVFLSD